MNSASTLPTTTYAGRVGVGQRLLRDLLVVASVVHGANTAAAALMGTWETFDQWEGVAFLFSMAGLGLWLWLPAAKRTWAYGIPVSLCVARWLSAWCWGAPAAVYTATISVVLYLPFLVAIALLIDIRRTAVFGTSALLSAVALWGVGRPELMTSVLSEWRLAPSLLASCVLLVMFSDRWRGLIFDLEVVREREKALLVKLQAETARQLAQRMEATTRMSGAMAHELNNLLAVVQPLSEQLAEDLTGEHQSDALDILASSKRARRLGQRLLLLTQSEAAVVEPVQLDALLRDAEPAFLDLLEGRHTLRLVTPNVPVSVRISAAEFVLVIRNLLTNAAEASADGSPITLSLQRVPEERDLVSVTVTDEGHGFPADLLPNVVDAYVTTRTEPGRGLGLTTAYAVAIRAGGLLRIENLPGSVGAKVTLTLPNAEEEAVHEEKAELLESRAAPVAVERLRVLVVDDEPRVLRATCRMLKRKGCEVHPTSSSHEALTLLTSNAEESFDVVLTDVRMPELSGPELFQEVQRRCTDAPPFLFITGHIDDSAAEKLGLPARHIVHKPCSADLLIERLHWIRAQTSP